MKYFIASNGIKLPYMENDKGKFIFHIEYNNLTDEMIKAINEFKVWIETK